MAAGAIAAVALAWAAKDPVVMTINGVDIPLSEFEYLFHKNSRQQLEAQPIEEYAEMFKLYKLKVADALADGLDTLPSFKKEMAQYRAELAAPYMADSTYIYSLVDEYAKWNSEEAEAVHLMKFKRNGPSSSETRATMDSIHQAILDGASWSEMVTKYSEDKSSASRDGVMTYITVGKYPYTFEKAVFTTPEGTISEVIETPNTYHIIRGSKHRPARGKVLVSHILKMAPEGCPPEIEQKVKHEIDSLYDIVKTHPELFAATAASNSDDKASARQGGQLSWFSAGEMIPEFDAAAFALSDGEISSPIRSKYGYHIILRHQGAPAPSYDEIKSLVINRTRNQQDPRFEMVLNQQTDRLMKRHNGVVYEPAMEEMTKYIAVHGLDSLFFERFYRGPESNAVIMTIGKKPVKKITRRDFFKLLNTREIPDPAAALDQFARYQMWALNEVAVNEEMDRLEKEEPEYRNLLKEYRDGSLLYEASVRKVWDKASQDTKGLEEFFQTHRNEYKWDRPHAKGWLIQATSDSIAQEARQLMSTLPADSMQMKLRKNFPGKLQIDRVIVAKGDNPLVDYLVFDGPEVQPKSSRYTTAFMFEPRILDQPEEASDVRGQVTTDYQNQLQQQWNEELLKKYPIKVYPNVLKKVK